MTTNNVNMKYIKLTFFVLFCSVLFSCSTTQTINVCGEPNSDIYSPEMVRLGTIDNSGNAKITLSSDGYYAYLLSKAPTSDKLIPFAIDYKNKNYTGTYLLRNVGMGISFAGCFSMFTGSLALLGGAEDIAATFFGIGGISALTGMAIGMPADFRSQQTQYEHKFKYLPVQTTNNDIAFKQIVDNGENKTTTTENIIPLNKTSSTSESNIKSTSTQRKLKNKKTEIQGTYLGSGGLYSGNKNIEEYDNIKVVVKKIGKKNAEVDVYENGSLYFSSTCLYSVTEENKGGYNLKLKDIPEASIKIDKNGNMSYYHPKVDIEGDIYILKISAKK